MRDRPKGARPPCPASAVRRDISWLARERPRRHQTAGRARPAETPGMTVANGREFLGIPGPTNIPDAVLAATHRPAIDIYSGDMLRITRTLLEDLPRIFRTT